MERNEIGKFGVGFIMLKSQEGVISFELREQNNNVSDEVIIMQLKIYLRNIKENYYNKYSKKNSWFVRN